MMHRKKIVLALCCVCAVLVTAQTFADTWIIDPVGTYTNIQAAYSDPGFASGDTILLTAGYTYTGAGLNVNLTFATDLIIGRTGQGADPIIDMENILGNYFCNISTGYTISMSNVVIQNGNGPGAIYNQGFLTLYDCIFNYNNNASSNGGAIGNWGGTLHATGCTFNKNHSEAIGGALFSIASTVTLDACTFYNNSAAVGGGAISTANPLYIFTSTFSGNSTNTSLGVGGALHVYLNAPVTVGNCYFIDNTAYIGGAIYLLSGTLDTNVCEFNNNNASLRGGCLYNRNGCIANLNECTFNHNNASTDGGNIYNDGELHAAECTFSNNKAGSGGFGNGGAFYNNSVVTLNCSRFVDNAATAANAIYSASGTATATNCWWGTNNPSTTALFDNTTVTYTPYIVINLLPDPLCIPIGTPTLITADFTQNSIGSSHDCTIMNGTPIIFSSPADIVITPTLAYIVDGLATTTVLDSVFTDTFTFCAQTDTDLSTTGYTYCATANPNIVYVSALDGDDVNFGDSPTSPVKTIQRGLDRLSCVSTGTLYLEQGNTFTGTNNKDLIITKTNLVITSYFGTHGPDYPIIDMEDSGRFCTIDQSSTVTMSNLDIRHGNADNGGAILNNGTLAMFGCTFNDNNATNGGVLYTDGTATLECCRFVDNTATAAHTIYNDGGTVTAINCWWGTNIPSATALFGGTTVTYEPYIIINLLPDPLFIPVGIPTPVTADFTHNSDGTLNGCTVMNGTPVIFSSSADVVITPTLTYFVDGLATTTVLDNYVTGTFTFCAETDTDISTGYSYCETVTFMDLIEVYVSALDGDDNNLGDSPERPVKTIQTGLERLSVVSTNTLYIYLEEGNTFTGTNNKDLTITKTNLVIATYEYAHGSANPIIDMEDNGRFCTIDTICTVTMSNLVIRNGDADNGGAILNNGTLAAFGCTFNANNADNGGVLYTNGTATLECCRFVGNTATTANAIYNDAGTATAINCWWGTNIPSATALFGGTTVTYSPYIIINLLPDPLFIPVGISTQVTADFTQNNIGSSHGCTIMNGTPVIFSSSADVVITPTLTYFVDGLATTTVVDTHVTGTFTFCAETDTDISAGYSYCETVTFMDLIEVYVSTLDGDDNNLGDTPERPVKTIQTALDRLSIVSTNTLYIYLEQGNTFTGTNNKDLIITKTNLVITSYFGTHDPDYPIIDMEDSGRFCTIDQSSTVTMSNLDIRHGNADNGGAILNNGTLAMFGCTFNANNADNGGVLYTDGAATLECCRFVDNTATTSAAAIYNDAGTASAINCWWGSNYPSATELFDGTTVTYEPYIILNLFPEPLWPKPICASPITADFTHSSDGSLNGCSIMEGTPVIFSTDSLYVTVDPQLAYIVDGQAQTTLYDIPDTNTLSICAKTDTDLSTTGYTYCETATPVDLTAVYVSALDGDDTNLGNSYANPVKTIQTGLNRLSCISTGTLYLEQGNTFTGTGNKNLPITERNLILTTYKNTHGSADPIIDMEGTGRFCTIDASSTVTMDNLDIRNGKPSGKFPTGGAIANNGTLATFNCKFSNNSAIAGGAIVNIGQFTNSGMLNVAGCTFSNNTADNFGGAIANQGRVTSSGIVNVTDCIFSINGATVGGAILNIGEETGSGVLNANGCIFDDNRATLGGVLYNGDEFTDELPPLYLPGTSIFECCRFVDNRATTSADALYNFLGTVTAQNCWWATNDPAAIADELFYGAVDYEPWIQMSFSVGPLALGQPTLGQADLTVTFSPSCIPDGTPVAFSITSGTIVPEEGTTLNGTVTAQASGFAGIQTVCAIAEPGDTKPINYSLTFFQLCAPVQGYSQPLAPADVIGRQQMHRFPRCADLVNVITWQAAEGDAPAAAYYEIFAAPNLDTPIATISANAPLRFVQHQREPHVIYVYYLYAVTAEGVHSEPVKVIVP